MRIVKFLVLSASFMGLGGCAVAAEEGDGEDLGATQQAARNRLCPMIYQPVCGKDGKTYSNECTAGGRGKIAYFGECVDPCASVSCLQGYACEVQKNGRPRCVEFIDPCATVRCASGTVCEVQKDGTAACVSDGTDPCAALLCGPGTICEAQADGTAACVSDPNQPCASVKCEPGFHCEEVQVWCITAPCYPIAECVADPV